ncbi:MAG: hypothetical protein JSS02_07720 [Planctomycetes bacterium]|nr:hypothetical protein [Planctomycetota bacterium]
MARNEADREDLMAEATALRQRVELQLPGESEPVVAGIRDLGRWSVYFGPDPVYGFDAEGGLRRAYVGGFLYRSQQATLSRLKRVRTETTSELHRYDLTPAELQAFLRDMTLRLASFQSALQSGDFEVRQQIPADRNLVPDLLAALQVVLNAPHIAAPLKRA